jgi:hypothetical protein
LIMEKLRTFVLHINGGWWYNAKDNWILGGHGFPSKGGEAVEVKDALTIMFLFGSFILALLTYINSNNKRK